MRQKSASVKEPGAQAVKNIRRATRRHFSAEDKIRIVLEGLRGEDSIAELCRREGITSSMYYGWSKPADQATTAVFYSISNCQPGYRRAIVEALDQQLKRGDKALIGNSAYRRYLRTTAKTAFEIDPGKLAEEARYDGLFVLRTNARITPLQAVLRYRDLIQVEQLFRTAKALMRTRPIYHSSDAAIRGHVFCSFLALILRKELDERCRKV